MSGQNILTESKLRWEAIFRQGTICRYCALTKYFPWTKVEWLISGFGKTFRERILVIQVNSFSFLMTKQKSFIHANLSLSDARLCGEFRSAIPVSALSCLCLFAFLWGRNSLWHKTRKERIEQVSTAFGLAPWMANSARSSLLGDKKNGIKTSAANGAPTNLTNSSHQQLHIHIYLSISKPIGIGFGTNNVCCIKLFNNSDFQFTSLQI